MPTIHLDSSVDAPASSVWTEVKDIRSPERLTDMIRSVDVLGDNERACRTDQGKIIETIISVDDERRRVAYTATESPFPATHHNAAFVVTDDGAGSRLAWTVDVEPAAVAEAIRPVLAAEFDVIVTRLAR